MTPRESSFMIGVMENTIKIILQAPWVSEYEGDKLPPPLEYALHHALVSLIDAREAIERMENEYEPDK